MKIRTHAQRFSRLTLTGMIGLGLTLVLAVFMQASTGLTAPLSPAQASSPRSGSQVLLAEDFSGISDKFTPPSGWQVTTGGGTNLRGIGVSAPFETALLSRLTQCRP